MKAKQAYLVDELGLSQAEWDAMRTAVPILNSSLSKMRAVVATLLAELEGATNRKIGLILPIVLSSPLRMGERRLERLKKRGITPEFDRHAKQVFRVRRQEDFDIWLSRQVSREKEGSLEEKRRWFVEALGVSQSNWAKLLLPEVKRRVEMTTLPELQSLVKLLVQGFNGADPVSVGMAVLKCPELGPALEPTVKRRLESFNKRQKGGVGGGEEGKPLPVWGEHLTDLFAVSTRVQPTDRQKSKIEAKREWLQSELFLQDHEWEEITLQPALFRRLHVGSLRKLRSIANLMMEEMDGATPREVGLLMPYLQTGNSVERTIKGRIQRIKDLGIRPVLGRHARAVTQLQAVLFEKWFQRLEVGQGVGAKEHKEAATKEYYVGELGLTEQEWNESMSLPTQRIKVTSTSVPKMREVVALVMEETHGRYTPREIGLEMWRYFGHNSVDRVVKPRLARIRAKGIEQLLLTPHMRAAFTYSGWQFEDWLSRQNGLDAAGLMEEKMAWFESALGLSEAETLALFNTESKMRLFKEKKLDKCKAILELLTREMEGATPQRVGLMMPKLMRRSIKRSLVPRLALLRSYGIEPNFETHVHKLCARIPAFIFEEELAESAAMAAEAFAHTAAARSRRAGSSRLGEGRGLEAFKTWT